MNEFKVSFAVFFVFLLLVFQGNADNTECLNNITKTVECCQDYKNISGKCEACIGMWGKNCLHPCSFNFYGHGCRQKCNCSHESERCDPMKGCQKITLTTFDNIKGFAQTHLTIPLSLMFVVLLIGTGCHIIQKLRKQRKSTEKQICSDVHVAKEELADYDFIRESQFIENAENPLAVVCHSLHNENQNINGNGKGRRTSESNDYEINRRDSCGYNHIDVKRKNLSSIWTSTPMNDYDKFSVAGNKDTGHKSVDTNDSSKPKISFGQADKVEPKVRLYSSVKYK
ncbi:uncharacterized protein LOC111113969 [Crassostrea virginica]